MILSVTYHLEVNMTINLVALLIGLLVFGLIAYVARWALAQFQAPQPVQMIVMVLLLIIFIVWLLGELGIGGPTLRVGAAPPNMVVATY